MAQASRLVKPTEQRLIRLEVLRAERLSRHRARVTLGAGEVDRFVPMGYDQWFRLFLPVGGAAGLERIPAKANKLIGYLRFLRIPEGDRPVMRNYTVRAYRPATDAASAEIDVDFVLHGSAEDGTAGPASSWAETCVPGESVVIIDEGIAFNPERGVQNVLLVADETGLPAIAGICASLPADASGLALIEVPSAEDALAFDRPAGVEVRWLIRDDYARVPGTLALSALAELTGDDVPAASCHAYVVGEQALPAAARRHLIAERGLDKSLISFCGYWRVGAHSAAGPQSAEKSTR
ncbi:MULTISPECIES: siderophore-interacting protein [unclassified Microbacterium]|uniref:siderophore-interacting protein n=1 Tax=unclassified Microbacterium TaxID=2609290 RepID=UPI000C2C5395|nr:MULTISPECIES: siderophore-interacting protein [unclassified Microbacterium]